MGDQEVGLELRVTHATKAYLIEHVVAAIVASGFNRKLLQGHCPKATPSSKSVATAIRDQRQPPLVPEPVQIPFQTNLSLRGFSPRP